MFIGFITAIVYSCKTQKLKVVFSQDKEVVVVTVNSGCRNSNVFPIVNEEELNVDLVLRLLPQTTTPDNNGRRAIEIN